MDPDLVAAMDDDFDYSDPDNTLEDNFLELAAGMSSDQKLDENKKCEVDSNFDDDEDSYKSSYIDSQESFEKLETKSKRTNRSMTSSVIRRNEQLTLLDKRFDKVSIPFVCSPFFFFCCATFPVAIIIANFILYPGIQRRSINTALPDF